MRCGLDFILWNPTEFTFHWFHFQQCAQTLGFHFLSKSIPALSRCTNPPLESSSESASSFTDKEDFANAILMWDSYSDFSSFCSKIGFTFANNDKAKSFFDYVRAQ